MPLPDLMRVMWASPAARVAWEPRIREFGRAWRAAEIASVQEGIRPATLQVVSPDAMVELSARAACVGMVVLPLAKEAASDAPYKVSSRDPVAGEPWAYRAVVAAPHVAEFMLEAWRSGRRDVEIGRLLGFPACCCSFFEETWNCRGLRDTTPAMRFDGAPAAEANILLRWIGVRLVQHLPCSFTCRETVALGREMARLLPPHVSAWAYEMLDWPMRWTARNGIAELETPCFRINMTTDYDVVPRELRIEGRTMPAEAASGIRFPYRTGRSETALPLQVVDARDWTDNGFASCAAMDAAHGMVRAALVAEGGAGLEDVLHVPDAERAEHAQLLVVGGPLGGRQAGAQLRDVDALVGEERGQPAHVTVAQAARGDVHGAVAAGEGARGAEHALGDSDRRHVRDAEVQQERQGCKQQVRHSDKVANLDGQVKGRIRKSLSVIDLGAGNGALLARLGTAVAVGVEADAARAARGRKAGRDVRHARIQDTAALPDTWFDMALMSARRLEEFSPQERAALRAWLEQHAGKLLLYSYDAPMFARVAPIRDVAP